MKTQNRRPLTSESVKQLYATMTQYYDTELIEHWRDNSDSSMTVLTLYLQHLNVKNVPGFLALHHLNIDHEIYLPYEPGIAGPYLITHVKSCAGAHQRIVHARQCDRPSECHLLYLLSPLNRVYTELSAIRAEMEVYWWYTAATLEEPLLPDTDYAEWMAAYGCGGLPEELVGVPAKLDEMMRSVKRGEVECDAAKDVISFFGWGEIKV